MTLPNIPQVKHPPGATWRRTQKLGAKPSQIFVCAGFFTPGKFIPPKPGAGANKYKGLRRVIFSYVLADGACLYPHATDPSFKGTFHAI